MAAYQSAQRRPAGALATPSPTSNEKFAYTSESHDQQKHPTQAKIEKGMPTTVSQMKKRDQSYMLQPHISFTRDSSSHVSEL
mmetsp:Transcript_10826/g.34480  ORF Transcript_10826/g.34480 Transcript_10826/m.34480 type:complete len:82 (-) Transcript_10826:292-537(-)